VEIVVDHADGTEAAARETLGELDAVFAVGADRDGMVVGDAGPVDPGLFTDRVHQLVAAGHGTAQGAADADVEFAGSLLAETGIEGDHLEDLDRLEPELRRGPLDRLLADVAEVVLQVVQHRKHRGTLAHRVMGDPFVDFVFQFLWYGEHVGAASTAVKSKR
jgi:hypothetical protein